MARNTSYDSSREMAGSRREFLHKATTLAFAACAAGASPWAWAAGVKPGLPPAGTKVTVVRWDAARFLADLSHLRAGWMPPCASLIGVPYPVSLSASLSAVPSVLSYEAAKPVRVRLLGYDGRCGIAALRLDALFNTQEKGGNNAYGWADVRNDHLISVPSTLNAWSIGGSIPLQISAGDNVRAGQIPIQIPAAEGVYLALITNQAGAPTASDVFFAEQSGGGYHRRLTTAGGRAVDALGYFVFVVQAMV